MNYAFYNPFPSTTVSSSCKRKHSFEDDEGSQPTKRVCISSLRSRKRKSKAVDVGTPRSQEVYATGPSSFRPCSGVTTRSCFTTVSTTDNPRWRRRSLPIYTISAEFFSSTTSSQLRRISRARSSTPSLWRRSSRIPPWPTPSLRAHLVCPSLSLFRLQYTCNFLPLGPHRRLSSSRPPRPRLLSHFGMPCVTLRVAASMHPIPSPSSRAVDKEGGAAVKAGGVADKGDVKVKAAHGTGVGANKQQLGRKPKVKGKENQPPCTTGRQAAVTTSRKSNPRVDFTTLQSRRSKQPVQMKRQTPKPLPILQSARTSTASLKQIAISAGTFPHVLYRLGLPRPYTLSWILGSHDASISRAYPLPPSVLLPPPASCDTFPPLIFDWSQILFGYLKLILARCLLPSPVLLPPEPCDTPIPILGPSHSFVDTRLSFLSVRHLLQPARDTPPSSSYDWFTSLLCTQAGSKTDDDARQDVSSGNTSAACLRPSLPA
ncbi:hypothetical protein B0H16DRAFT_1729899 [Mycena metata]|uniref:Uncharacterized protein n=1 Tax=Mycena metata TaxID=1033252 RepID=A0AAD7I9W8_9AGAR|nr:hypothetical protein B0H16DRAFT_1729899 [Mycena metata]